MPVPLTPGSTPAIEGPRPVAASISTDYVQALYACGTGPDAFNQLILAKLKDAGAPIEGALRLRPAHGKVFKLRDSALEERAEFTYMWIPDAYVEAIANAGGLQ
jgi:hypothetical protein